MKNATWTGYGVNKRGKPTKSFYQQAKEDWLRLRKEESSARLAYAEQARKTGSPESAKNYANQFPYSEEDYLKSHELAVKQLLQSIRRHEYAAQKATVDVNNLTAVIRTGEKANADEDQKEEAENAKAELLISEQLVKDIARKEYVDNMKLLCSFYVFILSAAYIFLKRFYLHEIIGFGLSVQTSIYQVIIVPII